MRYPDRTYSHTQPKTTHEQLRDCRRLAIKTGKEVAQLRADLAAARAEAERLRGALEAFRHGDGCFCEAAFAGPGTIPRHSPECIEARAALEPEAE